MVASPSVSNNPFQHNLNDVHGQLQVVNDCLQTLRVFLAPGQITQLVALRVEEPGRSTPIDYAGFFDFDHLDLMAREAAIFSGAAKGVHFTRNPLNPDVLNRCPNRVHAAAAAARDASAARPAATSRLRRSAKQSCSPPAASPSLVADGRGALAGVYGCWPEASPFSLRYAANSNVRIAFNTSSPSIGGLAKKFR